MAADYSYPAEDPGVQQALDLLASTSAHDRLRGVHFLELYGARLDSADEDANVPAILNALVLALNQTEPRNLYRTLKAVAEYSQPFGEEDFWDRIVAALQTCAAHPHPRVQRQALETMIQLCVPAVVPLLIHLATDSSARTRAFAIDSLGAFEYDRWDDPRLTADGVNTLVRALADPNPGVRRRAAHGLYYRASGTDPTSAGPALRAALNDPVPVVRVKALQALVQVDRENPETVQALSRLYTDPHNKVRKEAVSWTSSCGPNALLVMPALMERLNDSNRSVRSSVAWTCKYVGSQTVPYLIERLSHSRKRVRLAAADALSEQKERTPAIATALIEALDREQDAQVLNRILWTLRSYGSLAVTGQKSIAQHLRHPDEAVRVCAADTLMVLSHDHREVLELLREVEQDSSLDLPEETRVDIRRQFLSPEEEIQDLIRQVEQERDWSALQALKYRDALTPEVAVPALVDLIADSNERSNPSRGTLLNKLREYAPHAKSALPRLWELLDPDFLDQLDEFASGFDYRDLTQLCDALTASFKIRLAYTLWAIEPDDRIPEMLVNFSLTTHDIIVQTDLCHAWYHIGPPARDTFVVDYLMNILEHSISYDESWAATDALVSLAWVPEARVDELAEMLRKHNQAGWAARILKAIGPVKVAPVIEALRRDNRLSREFAADVLGSYGPAAQEAVPILREYLTTCTDNLRTWSAIALAQIEPSPEVVPVLIDTVQHGQDRTARSLALHGLGLCGDLARSALPVVEQACQDEDEKIRQVAQAVLERLR